MKVLTVLALLAAVAGQAAAQDLAAFPTEAGIALFDTGPMPTEAATEVHGSVQGATAGTCYASVGDGRLRATSGLDCLSYYLRPVEQGGRPLTVTGRLGFTGQEPDPFLLGLQLTEAEGLDYCGERPDCDRLLITGAADPSVLAELMATARQGIRVQIEARELWNLESVDLLVTDVSPLSE